MVRPARLCPWCGEINEPTVICQHTTRCERPASYDADMQREANREIGLWAFAFVAVTILVPLVVVVVT